MTPSCGTKPTLQLNFGMHPSSTSKQIYTFKYTGSMKIASDRDRINGGIKYMHNQRIPPPPSKTP